MARSRAMVGRQPLRCLGPPHGELLRSVVGVVARLGTPVEFAAERRVVAQAADAGEHPEMGFSGRLNATRARSPGKSLRDRNRANCAESSRPPREEL